jgi:hypothetical protein
MPGHFPVYHARHCLERACRRRTNTDQGRRPTAVTGSTNDVGARPYFCEFPQVSGDPSGHLPIDRGQAWDRLTSDGYLLTSERELGLPADFREAFIRDYFNDSIIRHDPGDFPVDRKRARDVIRYKWCDGDLRLKEYKSIVLKNRADIPGKRKHTRVKLLGDLKAKELVENLLSLVPPGERQSDGTFGINLFRTFTDVVTKPHQDDEQFVMLYVLDRKGDGAESYLYKPGDVAKDGVPAANARPVIRHQLQPGEILIFKDERFKHGATRLKAVHGETPQRDVLVCTVDYRDTYLRANVAGRVLDSASHHPLCQFARKRLRPRRREDVAADTREARVTERDLAHH